MLSVIIPVYNEVTTLKEAIRRVEEINLPKEIIVVDDGSTDGSSEIAEQLARQGRIKLIKMGRNTGKGAAFKAGLSAVRGEMVITQDADLEYDPRDLKDIARMLKRPEVEVVYGSRILKKDNRMSHPLYYIGGKLVTLVTNLLFAARLTDEPTCYKCFRSKVIRNLPLKHNGFELEPEITARLLKKGIRIYEVPISYNPRKPGYGKKLNWRDGCKAILTLLRYRILD